MIPKTSADLFFSLRAVLNAAADVNVKAMVAPTVVTSTIQLIAVRPKNGRIAETARIARIAPRGTPFLSSLPIGPGIRESSDILFRRRLRAT